MSQPRNHTLSKLSFGLLLIGLILLLASGPVLAQGQARVFPQNVEASGDTLAIDVMAESVANMYGAEFRVKYDPTVLAVQDADPAAAGIQIEPGSLLPADQGFVVANKVDEAAGTITFALTLLKPAQPVTGAGPLAHIIFKKLQGSPSTIEVAQAKLVSINPEEPGVLPQTIPSETASLAINNADQPQEKAPETAVITDTPAADAGSGFPWWIVAAAVLILGVLALGGFIILGGLGKSNSLTPVTVQPPDSQPARPSGSRPSAFKPRTPPADLAQKPHQTR